METLKHISIGKMLRKYIEDNNLSRTKLALKMGVPNTAFYTYEKQDSLQVSNLLRISEGLQYNFFMDIANQLPESYAFDKTLRTSKDFIITELEAEIQKLKLENDLMKEILTKRG